MKIISSIALFVSKKRSAPADLDFLFHMDEFIATDDHCISMLDAELFQILIQTHPSKSPL